MFCPDCNAPLAEHDAACVQCGFSTEQADRVFGGPPALHPPVCDLAKLLSGGEKQRLTLAARRFEAKFPQVRLAIITKAVPQGVPLRGVVFWLFNRAGLCSSMEKGGDCHLVLLFLDPTARVLSGMIGYGLEPFLAPAEFEQCLAAGQANFTASKWGEGLAKVLRGLDERFTSICTGSERTFGLAPEWTLITDDIAPAEAEHAQAAAF